MLGSPTLTLKGRNLLAKIVAANRPLTLSNIGLGDGLQEENESVTTLVNEIMKKEIESCKYNENEGQYYVRRVFTNEELDEGFYIREVGIYAIDPDEGEILYAYTNGGENGVDYFAPGTGKVIIKEIIEMATRFGNSEEINITIDPSVALVTNKEFEEYKKTNKEDINNLQEQIDENTTQLKDLANPSILINGDFRNPVNQRKTESISSTGTSVEGYFIDRWLCLVNGQGNSVVKNEGFISLIGKKGTSCSQCRQFVEFPKMYRGKNVAISFKYRVSKGSDKNNVRIYSNVKGIDNPWIFNDTLIPDGEWHIYNKILSIPNSDSITGFAPIWISCINIDFNTLQESPLTEDCQIDVEWVKSEIGNKVTPFIPRPYGEELALCQRYYEEVPAGQQVLGVKDNVNAFIYWNFIVEKRINPTVSFTHPGYDNNHVNAYSNNIELANTPVEIEWTNKRTARMKIPALSSVPIGSAISAFGAITIDAEIY